jgi:hypothetical protein
MSKPYSMPNQPRRDHALAVATAGLSLWVDKILGRIAFVALLGLPLPFADAQGGIGGTGVPPLKASQPVAGALPRSGPPAPPGTSALRPCLPAQGVPGCSPRHGG